ncbi:FkbM family methyltransferase [Ostreiculturibacter nitratireducens]|uniref:FkbM family methyltransferase n=1 Tax=Ostreiculturibacter nitratireducens TaxID=3075226 RepID=UPI0031B5BB6E
MAKLDLDFRRQLQFRLHNLAARFGIGDRKPVAVRLEGDSYIVTTEGREVIVPSAMRWKFYRRGWNKRLDRLRRQFGVGDPMTVEPGETVIDVGANVGEFSLAVAARGARVFAIEGDPKVFECLTRNIAGVKEITPEQALIWRTEETLTFYSVPHKADSSIFKPVSDEGVQAISLPATTLDRFAERHGIESVALLKCDAEGAEPEVIEGGRDLLSRTRQVAFDTGPERMGQETSADVERLLAELGFSVTHETRLGRKITFGRRAT